MYTIFTSHKAIFHTLVFCALSGILQKAPAQDISSPVSILHSRPDFSGPEGRDLDEHTLKKVRIGLFMPGDPDPAMINAAGLAISEINESGGYKGIPFRLITRWASDPWAAGSKEMIKLIYKDSVLAVIGSIDGTATHIAEQIVTKAWVPLISPVSADPTLNYVNIPWMFRLAPDFHVQSEVIVEQGITRFSLQRIGLITSIGHDGRIFSEEMLTALSDKKLAPLFHFQLPETNADVHEIISRINEFDPQGVILFLPPEEITDILLELNKKRIMISCFIPWVPGFDNHRLPKDMNIRIYYIDPFRTADSADYQSFAGNYFRRYMKYPVASAAYTYDAVWLIAHALNRSGLNRVRLRGAIAGMSDFRGVTGKIKWDNGGGNLAEPYLEVSGVKLTE